MEVVRCCGRGIIDKERERERVEREMERGDRKREGCS